MINPCEKCFCRYRCENRHSYELENAWEIFKCALSETSVGKVFFKNKVYPPEIKCSRIHYTIGMFSDCDQKMLAKMFEYAASDVYPYPEKIKAYCYEAAESMKAIYDIKAKDIPLYNKVFAFENYSNEVRSFNEFMSALFYEASERCLDAVLKEELKK